MAKNIDQNHRRANSATQSTIKRKFGHLKIEEKETVKEYFSRFETLL